MTPWYVSSPDNPLRVEIHSPLLKGKSLQCRVIDLTLDGFSIAMVSLNDLFVEGMVFSQVTLIFSSETQDKYRCRSETCWYGDGGEGGEPLKMQIPFCKSFRE